MPADNSDTEGLHDWRLCTRVAGPDSMLEQAAKGKGISIIPLAGGRRLDEDNWEDGELHRNAHNF